jgi:hypothetical protein
MVKLKTRIRKTDNLEEVELAEKYGKIEQTRSGNYELIFPTQLNEFLKPDIGKDFDMDFVVEDGQTLRIALTPDKFKKNKGKNKSIKRPSPATSKKYSSQLTKKE